MGYTTEFTGAFNLDKPLSAEHAEYLRKFSSTRRMRRDASVCEGLPDPIREAVGLPVGEEGEFFVGGAGFGGQDKDPSILEYNRPPKTQPGLWCQWVPNPEGTAMEWDGNEKFYDYVEWLEYLIESFLKPWGYVLNGAAIWEGEERGDEGTIVVTKNVVRTAPKGGS